MARIAELEGIIAINSQDQGYAEEGELQSQEPFFQQPPSLPDLPPTGPTSSSGLVQLANTASQQSFSQALSASNRRGNSANGQQDGMGGRHKNRMEEQQIPTWTSAEMEDVYADTMHYNQSFDTLSLPSYSPNLPPPHIVHHLCEIFCSRHPLRSMMYQPDLMASLR